MSKDFQVHIFASGSKGNAILVQGGGVAILLDAGISARRIEAHLSALNISLHELAGIFITHEHADHVRGLPALAKKTDIPVFARERTWLALANLKAIKHAQRRLLPKEQMSVGDLTIRPFEVSHDAAEPVGFNVFCGARKGAFATDLGFGGREVKEALADSDIIVLEANHDPLLLAQGDYPPFLKKRISSRNGHLSNAQAGKLLADVAGKKEATVFLAHLSQNNNRPELAQKTVLDVLTAHGLDARFSLRVALPDSCVSS